MIDYLKIEGFKSFGSLEVELRPINMLIGSNGSGKSNFLSFFRLIRAIFSQQLQKHVIEEKADNVLRFGRKHTATLYAKMIFTHGEDDNNAYIFKLAQDATGGLYIESERSGFCVRREDDVHNYFSRQNSTESTIARSATSRDIHLRDYVSTLKTFHFHDTSATSPLRKECDIEDNGALYSDGRNLPAFLYLLQERHSKAFARIVKAIQSVAPYIDRLILEPSKLAGGGRDIALRWADVGDSESTFSAYQLSDGTLRFIALATLLMQPAPPDVILIDEPELGLHPFAIGKLAGMIQAVSGTSQIIAATQSPGLISHFAPRDVLVLDRSTDGRQTVIQRLEADRLAAWLTDYSLGDLWEKNILNAAQPFQK